jgi:hypothetical protein
VEDFGLPVLEVELPSPQPSPVAYWNVGQDSVTLGIAELGAVQVHGDRISVLGPDDSARENVWTRLRYWAIGQYFAAQGYRVLFGCVVARNGRAVALTGSSRCGATMLGLQMTRWGWGIVSDGVIAIDSTGTCRALQPRATLDTEPAQKLFGDYPQEVAASGRDRRVVWAPEHGDAPLCAIVTMQVKDAVEPLSILRLDRVATDDRDWMTGVVSCIPAAPTAARLPEVPTIVVRRSRPRSLEELAQVSPPVMAEGLNTFLLGLGL